MTTRANLKLTSSNRIATRVVLVGLAVAATACASSGGDDSAVVDIGPSTDESTGVDDLEYGDSLEDLTHASAAGAALAVEVLPGFRSIEWDALIPPGFSSEEILARYEDRLKAAEPGSPELDALYAEMQAEYDDASLNPQLDSEDIQLAGFVAPLTFDGDDITEFLLVPYFGACIHVPPPPANQTVMVTLPEGESISLEESWGAVWVAGKMIASPTNTDLATAGYSISGAQFGVYQAQ